MIYFQADYYTQYPGLSIIIIYPVNYLEELINLMQKGVGDPKLPKIQNYNQGTTKSEKHSYEEGRGYNQKVIQ